ncbi:MAG: dihydroorotate dehydrogenase [Desulfovibrionaceae bacterium]
MGTSIDVSVKVGSLSLKNPVLTASGTFGFGMEFSPYGALAALGGFVVKGLSLKPRAGNPMPRIAETPCGMLNAIGIQNPGVETFLAKVLPALPVDKTAVVANLYGCDAGEFAELAGLLADAGGLAALEVNVSCPNVSQGGILFGQDPLMITRVTEAVKARAGSVPVWVKLSPNVTDIAACARAAEAGGADAVTLINTLSGMAVDVRTRRPLLANVIGGLSGPAVKPVALRCVWQASRAVSIPVVGIGGICSAEDVLEFILVGASAVQVGTANFQRPDAAFAIAAELPAAMQRLGVSSLEELRGSLGV